MQAVAACTALVPLAQAQAPVSPTQISAAVPAAPSAIASVPIAIVPIDASSTVTGALEITSGRALIATSGTVTSGLKTTEVILPRRGTLRVCASTTVRLAADPSAPASDVPGLMLALDHGALEASFATGRSADVVLTPDFRILIGAGASDLKIRMGQHGDTCVDNPGQNAPSVLVTSVFDGSTYQVQPMQRVMFQHGSLQEVVDSEKEPCGCPPDAHPGTNDFPAAESAGLAPQSPPVTQPAAGNASKTQSVIEQPLIYQAQKAPTDESAKAPAATTQPLPQSPAKTAARKKPGVFHRIGNFFKRVFGAE